jgi:anti-sigma regulatory factor (Ser/Thr protein kinase)
MTPPQTGQWSWPLPFSATAAATGRGYVTGVLQAFGVDDATIDTARLVVSELVGNALRHARPRADGHVVVAMSLDAQTVSVAVSDGGGPSVPAVVPSSLMSLGGRGLRIVHTVSRDWGVREAAEGNTVFAVVTRA